MKKISIAIVVIIAAIAFVYHEKPMSYQANNSYFFRYLSVNALDIAKKHPSGLLYDFILANNKENFVVSGWIIRDSNAKIKNAYINVHNAIKVHAYYKNGYTKIIIDAREIYPGYIKYHNAANYSMGERPPEVTDIRSQNIVDNINNRQLISITAQKNIDDILSIPNLRDIHTAEWWWLDDHTITVERN